MTEKRVTYCYMFGEVTTAGKLQMDSSSGLKTICHSIYEECASRVVQLVTKFIFKVISKCRKNVKYGVSRINSFRYFINKEGLRSCLKEWKLVSSLWAVKNVVEACTLTCKTTIVLTISAELTIVNLGRIYVTVQFLDQSAFLPKPVCVF